MIHCSYDVKKPCLMTCFALVATGLILAGCSPHHYKQYADREVYKIIDQKWREDFGSKANYRISDVQPDAADITVEQPVPPSGVLTLAQAVALATAQNRGYQDEKELLYLTALDLTLERYRFTPVLFGAVNAFYVRDADEKNWQADGEFGFDLLLADGARISSSIASDWIRFITGDPRASLTSVLSGTVTQPLLQGAGREVVMENLSQAERDTLYQLRSFSRFRKNFVVGIISAYYRVLQARNEVKNAKDNYERLTEAKQRLEMLAQAGRLQRFQVDQAEQDQLRGWDSYVRTQQEYEQQLDSFKMLLSLPTDAKIELAQEELDVLRAAGITDPQFNLPEAVETALARRLDLANARDQVADAERKIKVAANNLLAKLDVVGTADVNSPEDIRFGQREFSDGRYSLGLELDLPLDRKAERNAYRQALITLLRRRRAYEQKIDDVKLQVRNAYRNLTEAAQRYKIQQKSLTLAKKRVESTTLLVEAGRAITRDRLEAEDALLDAQNAIIDALVRHTIAKLEFFRDIGVLQVKPDGFWTLKERNNDK